MVIGAAGNVKGFGVAGGPMPAIYFAKGQARWRNGVEVLVRTEIPPLRLAGAFVSTPVLETLLFGVRLIGWRSFRLWLRRPHRDSPAGVFPVAHIRLAVQSPLPILLTPRSFTEAPSRRIASASSTL